MNFPYFGVQPEPDCVFLFLLNSPCETPTGTNAAFLKLFGLNFFYMQNVPNQEYHHVFYFSRDCRVVAAPPEKILVLREATSLFNASQQEFSV